jgi:CRISPR/Cas system CSM-associated protein Csm3 (group 7 of RAMP superfamily)
VSSLSSVDIPLLIEFEQSLHVGTGGGDGLVDRRVRRTAGGEPCVPASAIKGALRQTAQRLLRSLDAAAEFGDMEPSQHLGYRRRGDRTVPHRCEAPSAETMCKSRSPCLLCRVFGNVYTGRRLIVDDATAGASPDVESRRALLDALGEEDSGVVRDAPATGTTETITRLQMDRRRLGAKSGALFTTEYARAQPVFEGRLAGSIPLTPLENSEAEPEPAELVLLAATLRATDQIGGEASSGRGACRIRVPDRQAPDGTDSGAGSPRAGLRVGGETYEMSTLLRPESLSALRWSRVEGSL